MKFDNLKDTKKKQRRQGENHRLLCCYFIHRARDHAYRAGDVLVVKALMREAKKIKERILFYESLSGVKV